jgi:hypothetical protein
METMQSGKCIREHNWELMMYVLVPLDRIFVATLYTSDTDKIMRYTDEVRVLASR